MVRRLKSDLREIGSNFPKREVVPIKFSGLPADAPELRLAELLSQYGDMREEQLQGRRPQGPAGFRAGDLASPKASALLDRSVCSDAARSSRDPGAAGRQGRRRAARRAAREQASREAPGADNDRAELPEEEVRAEEESQVESATPPPQAARAPD